MRSVEARGKWFLPSAFAVFLVLALVTVELGNVHATALTRQYKVKGGNIAWGCLPPSGCECGAHFGRIVNGSFSATESNSTSKFWLSDIVINLDSHKSVTGDGILQQSIPEFEEDGRIRGRQNGSVALRTYFWTNPLTLQISEPMTMLPSFGLYIAFASNGMTCRGVQMTLYADLSN
jgi:hypothetical protein